MSDFLYDSATTAVACVLWLGVLWLCGYSIQRRKK